MKIGIDLDEVIMDTLKQVIKFYNKKTNSNFKEKDFFSYDWWEVWGGTREEAVSIWYEFNNTEESENIPPIKDVVESLNILKKSNELFGITSRSIKLKEKTERWIKYNLNFPFEIFHTSDFYTGIGKSKVDTGKGLGIKLIIEDNGKYALECAQEGIKAILFNKPWNQGISHPNIKRVNNWKEALEAIKNA